MNPAKALAFPPLDVPSRFTESNVSTLSLQVRKLAKSAYLAMEYKIQSGWFNKWYKIATFFRSCWINFNFARMFSLITCLFGL
jgi:hypothetical protein